MGAEHAFDVVVIGAGPAGMAAAVAAASHGAKVCVVDENAFAGGQIWRRDASEESAKNGDEKASLARFAEAKITRILGAAVIATPSPSRILIETSAGARWVECQRLIVATGARERFLPFPGWTLPGVFGAGGLQAMVKGGMSVAGKSVLVAGSGPLLLPVARMLVKKGATVTAIAEQASWGKLAGFSTAVLKDFGKLKEALGYQWALRGVPYWAGSWPVSIQRNGEGLSVKLRQADELREVRCDYLACGFFLVPNLELARSLGCDVRGGAIVNELQETSVAGVFAAGEVTGVGGLEKSLVEGQIAGHAAVGKVEICRRLFGARAAALRFAEKLRAAFELCPELKQITDAQTIVCRCEDVEAGRLARFGSSREAKLQTRCGMGACQGRVCGPACEFLFGWRDASVRLPFSVSRLDSFATCPDSTPRDQE